MVGYGTVFYVIICHIVQCVVVLSTIPPAALDRSEGLNYTIVIHITPHTMIVYD